MKKLIKRPEFDLVLAGVFITGYCLKGDDLPGRFFGVLYCLAGIWIFCRCIKNLTL